jgi:hypothetical protein
MHRSILRFVAPFLGLALSATSALAEPLSKRPVAPAPIQVQAIQTPHNCTCRAKGTDFQVGDLVCLSTPNGASMARCEMVLNNTSWKVLNAPCPQS